MNAFTENIQYTNQLHSTQETKSYYRLSKWKRLCIVACLTKLMENLLQAYVGSPIIKTL